MKIGRIALLTTFALAPLPGLAGDLAVLPKDDAQFRDKIAGFVKPGGKAGDARKLLETDRFECKESTDRGASVLWCGRTDGDSNSSVRQRYQVVMRLSGSSITKVETYTSLVGL